MTTTSPPVVPASAAPSRSVPPTRSPQRRSGPVLRTSYPGISRLVIVESSLNQMPAGITALNTVAAYTSALATVTLDGTIEPARRLASRSCTSCQSDIKRIGGYIDKHQTAVGTDGKLSRWTSVALFLRSISDSGLATVEFDGTEATLQLRSSSGTVLAQQAGDVISDDEIVQTGLNPRITAEVSR